ncbi:MAG: thiamine pyrophosphate-dependent enzyme [Burkholderiaceae bacterium]|jgi:phosphonopyruvate decarboxylase|nr:thiamine pyrophosphate-dependent enzyme [Burkholderiaceae bacterium]
MSNIPAFSGTIERRAFVKELIDLCPGVLVVPGLGSSNYDIFAAGDRDENFYMWGAMGGAALIGLGLALAQPSKSVLVITGDGEQLMGIGGLATINAQQPKNLTIVVLDNGHFGETGMQHSHSSLGTDLTAVAKGCGIANSFKVREASDVKTIQQNVLARAGVAFAQVYVKADDLPRALPSRDGVYIKNRFRQALGFAPL